VFHARLALVWGTFNVAKSDVYYDAALLGTKFQKKKEPIHLRLLLLRLLAVCSVVAEHGSADC